MNLAFSGVIPVTAQIGGTGWKTSLFGEGWAVHRASEGVGAEGRKA
jgi:hypothetical protein